MRLLLPNVISSNLRVMPPFNDNGLHLIFGLFESVDPAVYPPPVEGEGWPAGRQEPATRYETTRVCNYCLGKGHWKADCPVLKQKAKPHATPERSAGPSSCLGVCTISENDCLIQSCYLPFMSDGLVSLLGSTDTVPVKILRDTGSSESFVIASVLPFNVHSYTGKAVVVRGFGPYTFSLPLHRVNLQSQLGQGEVTLCVCKW